MAFAPMNAHVQHSFLTGTIVNDASGQAAMMLPTSQNFSLFNVPAPVDVTGMEFAVAYYQDAGTLVDQNMASAASTFEIHFVDQGTTGTTLTTNVLAGADAFSNTPLGGWTAGQAKKTAGTSTTDMDADDWIALDVIANATGLAGAICVGAAFIYGIPGAIN